MKKLQALDETTRGFEYLLGDFLGYWLQQEGDNGKSLFLEEIERENDGQEYGGNDHADDAVKLKTGVRLFLSLEIGRIEGFGQKKNREQKTHGEHVEYSLNDDRADSKSPAYSLFLCQVQRLDQLSQPSWKKEGDREPDSVSGEHMGKLGSFFLMHQEEFPAKAPGSKMNGNKDNDQDKEFEVHICQVAQDFLPFHAAEEKEEENQGEEEEYSETE